MANDMLNPKDRKKFLEHLRPPEGFKFDRAIGTTYSLDLVSLLIAPLAMVFFESEDKDEVLKDPTALLESLQETKGRLSLFCQAGCISVPKTSNCLLNLLSSSVIEVEAPNPEGVFHPKVWLLRYVGSSKTVIYRLICLSRNMTFDQSWDTMLVLEGEYDRTRTNAFGENRPLSEFIAALPKLAKKGSPDAKQHARIMADEVLRVRFEPPEPFEKVAFWPIGIEGRGKGPDFESWRTMIVSPFLSEGALAPIATAGAKNALISRLESLDALDPAVLKRISQRGKIYVMNDSAEAPEPSPEEAEARTLGGEDPSGLHAKLYIAEDGWNAHVFTGSANATNAGLRGVNVEFLVELVGKKSKVGVDSVLGEGKDETKLLDLLLPYQIRDKKADVDEDKKKLETILEGAWRVLASADWRVLIDAEGDQKFRQVLAIAKAPKIDPEVKISCWPALLPSSHAAELDLSQPESCAAFAGLSTIAVGGFMAFRLQAAVGKSRGEISFVLSLPTEGLPEGRDRDILLHVISDPEHFVRYLLLLLSRDPEQTFLDHLSKKSGNGADVESHDGSSAIPLFEELLRACSRSPDRIHRIGRVVDELRRSPAGQKVLPPGFDRVWKALLESVPPQEAR